MTQVEDINKSSSRHWLYGFNAAILAVVGAVILCFALYLTSTFTHRFDCTTGGMYSLSDSTRKLVGEIDKAGQKFELISLMISDGEHITQVNDLTAEYARLSPNITASNFAGRSRQELEAKIKERYQSELKPYEDTVGDFEALATEIEKFSQVEAANYAALAQKPTATAEDKKQAAQFNGLFGSALPDLASKSKLGIKRISEGSLPDWRKATNGLKAFFTQEEIAVIITLADREESKGALATGVQIYMETARPRYEELVAKMKAYQARLAKLPELKVQDVLDSIAMDTLVIIGPTSAKVVDQSTLYRSQGPANPGSKEPTASFEGEQALSSALLSMIRPDKVKVVIVTPSAANLLSGQMSSAADRLRDANFDVLEWSPPGGAPNPQAPPPSPEPPAIGKGVVWIVLPPDPPNPQMMMMGMMPPSPKGVIDAVTRHLNAGGQVMMFAEAGSDMFNPDGGKYPYDDLARPFGIQVKSNYTIVKSYPTADGTVSVPEIQIRHFPDSPITKPLQSLLTDFTAQGRSRSGFVGAPTVVTIDDKKPVGVDAHIIVDTGNDGDAWGESSMTAEPKFDPKEDLKSPVPMAVAASKKITIDGKTIDQRMVVIGNKVFAFNGVLDVASGEIRSGQLYVVPRFPGNGELLLNSVLWLSGYENMIAVSSKSTSALRIRDISPGTLLGVQIGVLWLGAPLAVLLLGVVVWMFRRS